MNPSRTPLYPRILALTVAVGTIVAVITFRLAWLGLVRAAEPSADLPAQSVPARRGTLWDRRGAPLAVEDYVYRAGIAPREVGDPDTLAREVAAALGAGEAEVRGWAVDSDRVWVPLASGVPAAVARDLDALGLDGLHFAREARRTYPLGEAAAHVTGYVSGEGMAYYGVEEHYDTVLRGRSGSLAGARGSDTRAYLPPRDGNDLVLTIDRELQVAAYAALTEALAAQSAPSGTVVAIDPATGAILAMASLPSYDPSQVGRADVANLPDPAVSAIYEPGSVLKAVTLVAALDAGVITPDSVYDDTGEVVVDGLNIENWDRLAHGPTGMIGLLQLSLNVGAVHVAQALGVERFYGALAAFGFGSPTGVDLAGEVPGLVAWPGDGRWYPGQLATNSFGQGLAATPLQVAAAMAAIANDGRLMRPHIVAATIAPDGTRTPVAPEFVRQAVSPSAARAIRLMLSEVVSGKVTQAAVPGFSVGGKTGTSQIAVPGGYDPVGTIASFGGFLPVERPAIVIVVKIDRPDAVRGSEVAAPLFATVAGAAMRILGVAPDRPTTAAQVTP